MMINLEIPEIKNGKVNFSKLELDLGKFLCNDPQNTCVNLVGNNKKTLIDLRNNLYSSFDYKILKVGKRGNNYLIKVGAKI